MFGTVIINARAAKRLQAGYPWVPDNDITSRKFDIAGLVAILDNKGKILGQGFYSPESKVKLRFLTNQKKEITPDLFAERIKRAEKRRALFKNITNAYRVVFAESDFLPSIVIDRFNDIFAIQFNSDAARLYRDTILKIVVDQFHPASVIEKDKKAEILYGKKVETEIFEATQHFEVNVLKGQKTGAYLDYRNFRLKGAEICEGKALDLFCYNGWFSCHVAKKATSVIGVDSSHDAILAAGQNAKINAHKNVKFIESDCFDFLKNCQEKFDFIHLDPPPFAKERANLQPAIIGYKKLTDAALKLLNNNGILFISSCSRQITEGILEKVVDESLKKGGRKYNVVFRGIQDGDHPVLKGFPESLYLKAMAVKV